MMEKEDKKLSKGQCLEIRCSHLERDVVNKEIQGLLNKIEFLEREKILCGIKVNELKASKKRKEKEHSELIDSIGKKLKVDLKNSVINPESGEITFV